MGEFDRPDSRWGAGHRGVDLLGAEDQQVRAAGAGVVTYAGLLAGRGVVAVSHGVLRTTYEPVAAAVDVGARVSTGTVLGTLTGSQSHCAPRSCLHWGAIRAGEYVNPLSLVMPSTPRLLPLGDVDAPGTLRGPGQPPGDPGREVGRPTTVPAATAATVGASAQADGAAAPDISGEGSGGGGNSVGPAMRKLSAAVSTFAPPAAGALAGAIAAGVVVRLSRQARGGGPSPPAPPPCWPPASASRRDPGRGGVIDLTTVRQRLRDAA